MSDIDQQFIGYVSATLESMKDNLRQLRDDVADLKDVHGFCELPLTQKEVTDLQATVVEIRTDIADIKKIQTTWTLKEAKLIGILAGLGLTAGGLSAYIMKIVGLLQ